LKENDPMSPLKDNPPNRCITKIPIKGIEREGAPVHRAVGIDKDPMHNKNPNKGN
jgi:hypothetical protein